MSGFPPTPEQQQALDAYAGGGDLRIEAGAGTGKSTTLRMLAQSAPQTRHLYVAFNKAVADESSRSFPPNTECRTAHSLAFRAVGRAYRHRFNAPRLPAREVARILGLDDKIKVGDKLLHPHQQSRLATSMVKAFCASADTEVQAAHLPDVPGVERAQREELAAHLLPAARKVWADLTDPNGSLRYEQAAYLKQFSLTQPNLRVPVILYDEAQDANPAVAAIIAHQQRLGARLVVVGDSAQAIYGFTGARDAMNLFSCDHTVSLTKSFRFGPAVADEANKWLTLLGSNLRLRGHEPIQSVVGKLSTSPDAVLCRTNVGVLGEVIAAQAAGVKVAVAGGTSELKHLTQAAQDLQAGRATSHPELLAFTTWQQVQEYADSDEGSDLASFVSLIDEYSAATLLRALDATVSDPADAALTASSAHRAKGLEWDRVRIGNDFPEPDPVHGLSRDEAMLAYVAVTRAKKHLDRGSLSWIDTEIAAGRTIEPSPQLAHPDAGTRHNADQPTVAPTPTDITPITLTLLGGQAGQVRAAATAAGQTPEQWVRQSLRSALEGR